MAEKADAFVRAAGVVSESGDVDIDKLKTIAVAGFKSAGHLDLLGGLLGFDTSDVEDLFAFLSR